MIAADPPGAVQPAEMRRAPADERDGAGRRDSPREPLGPRTLSRGTHYRPALDGLRAVAVYLVVAYHAGVHRFSGGYIGVDVFFVLSGYLVTQLLLRDLGSTGRISFARFYSRRFRRLLPAAFVTLLVTAAIYVAVAAPSQAVDAIGGFRSAFLYVANWYFIGQSSDYFAADVANNPVVHFWSLAVEEQFYLLWPLILTAIFVLARRAGRQQWNVLRAVILFAGIASFASAVRLSHVDLSRAYYGTDTRAYQLLAGALLAMSPQIVRSLRRRRRIVQALAPLNLAVLILLGTSVVDTGPIVRGLASVVATCGLILAVEVAELGLVKRFLSTPTAVYLGRVSYGTYLWHWPFIVIVTMRFRPNGPALFALTCLGATGLASLSYQVLELRVRESRRLDAHRRPIIAIGLAVSVISGLVIVPAILRHHDSSGTTAAALAESAGAGGWRVPVPASLDISVAKNGRYGAKTCFEQPVDKCVAVRGTGKRILLVGDSHAMVLVPAFAELAHRLHFSLAVAFLPNCPWQQGLVPAAARAPASLPTTCRAHQDDWYSRVLPQFEPDIVALAYRGYDDPESPVDVRAPDGHRVAYRSSDFEAVVRDSSQHTIDLLRSQGRKVVIVEPIPLAPGAFDPLACLSRAKYLEECRQVATSQPLPIERFYRSIADGTHVWSLNIDRLICPYFPICDPVIESIIVKKDPQHMTAAFSTKIGASLEAVLLENGIIGGQS